MKRFTTSEKASIYAQLSGMPIVRPKTIKDLLERIPLCLGTGEISIAYEFFVRAFAFIGITEDCFNDILENHYSYDLLSSGMNPEQKIIFDKLLKYIFKQ